MANILTSQATGMTFIAAPHATDIVGEYVTETETNEAGGVWVAGYVITNCVREYAVHRFSGMAGAHMECYGGHYVNTLRQAWEDLDRQAGL